jgi:hypothetical protein
MVYSGYPVYISFPFVCFRNYEDLRIATSGEGINMGEYGDVFHFKEDGSFRGRRRKTLEEWKVDPSVIAIIEDGLPSGWAKIVRQFPDGKRVFFKSPTKSHIG